MEWDCEVREERRLLRSSLSWVSWVIWSRRVWMMESRWAMASSLASKMVEMEKKPSGERISFSSSSFEGMIIGSLL